MTPETRAFLEQVRDAEDPTPEDERRVLAAVRATVAVGAAAGTGVTVAKVSQWLASLGGWKVGALAACVAVGAAAVGATVTEPSNESLPPAKAAAVAPPPQRRPAPPLVVPRPTAETPEAPAPRQEDPARRHPPPSKKLVTSQSLRDELTLLETVQLDLKRGDGAQAVERLESHKTDDTQLLAERRAAMVLALCAAGRPELAREAASEFLSQHPTSAQRSAVERSCGAAEKRLGD